MSLRGVEGSSPVRATGDLQVRLRWLLGLRWLVLPALIALVLATDLITSGGRAVPILVAGGLLLALHAGDAFFLRRERSRPTLLLWGRFEAGLVVAAPLLLLLAQGDSLSPLRYAVVVGVAGAAVVLPRARDVFVVGLVAVVALVAVDSLTLDVGGRLTAHRLAARWLVEAGVVLLISAITAFLQGERAAATGRLAEAEAEWDRIRAEWEAALDRLAELVVVTDGVGLVLRANRAFAQAAGVRPMELPGRPLSQLLAGHPERWWTEEAEGVVSIEDPIFDSLFEVSVARFPDRVVRVARDVGDQRRLHARLVQADKLAGVGALAAGVAHEINNPTAVVTSNLTELARYVQNYESAFSALTAIALETGGADRVSAVLQRPEVGFARREAGNSIAESLQGMERIRQVVASLRSVTRRDAGGDALEPVALVEVIEAVVRTAAHDLRAASARVDLREPCLVLGRRGELVDVVLNLVVNAIQAAAPGRPNRVSVELRREGAMAVLRISDTGKGISPAHLRRLFTPFFTTKGPGEGSGLGLSLARNIVLAHGGSVDVQTELGVGSTFTVRLPLAEVDGGEPAARGRHSGTDG